MPRHYGVFGVRLTMEAEVWGSEVENGVKVG